MMAHSSTVTWPPKVALLAMTTWSPTMQSWATWVAIMNRQLLPTRVSMRPWGVPGFMVTCSRMTLSVPISRRDGSPRYLVSWGGWPIEEKG